MTKTIIWKQRRRKEIREKIGKAILITASILLWVLGALGFYEGFIRVLAEDFGPEAWISDGMLHKVSCTAYVDTETSTGRKPTEKLTVAGPREWTGCTCAIYSEELEFLGYYEFMDVGYGTETDYGESRLRKGEHLGTIEAGECIDLYFDSEAEVEAWGKRKVYIQVIRSAG